MSTTLKNKGELKSEIKQLLDLNVGNEKTKLNKVYKNKITERLLNGSNKTKHKWATYNQLVVELNKAGLFTKKKELQYKLTDNEQPHPKKICLNILRDTHIEGKEFNRLYHKIMNF